MTRDEISSVRITTGEWGKNKNILGLATAYFTNGLVLQGLKVIRKVDGGLFVGMPSKQVAGTEEKAKYQDIAYFANQEDRETFQAAVLDVYRKEVGQKSGMLDSTQVPPSDNNLDDDIPF